jgi:hypothetical protein
MRFLVVEIGVGGLVTNAKTYVHVVEADDEHGAFRVAARAIRSRGEGAEALDKGVDLIAYRDGLHTTAQDKVTFGQRSAPTSNDDSLELAS